MTEYYTRKGEPTTQEQWLQTWQGENKRVAKTTVGDAEVSTVYLGLNHNFGDGPPLIFETMIFGGDHNEDMWRYSSEEQARAGHESIVAALRDGSDPDGADSEA